MEQNPRDLDSREKYSTGLRLWDGTSCHSQKRETWEYFRTLTSVATFVATSSFITPVLSRSFKKCRIKQTETYFFLVMGRINSLSLHFLTQWDHLGLSFSTSRECDARVLPFAESRPATLCLSGGHSPQSLWLFSWPSTPKGTWFLAFPKSY